MRRKTVLAALCIAPLAISQAADLAAPDYIFSAGGEDADICNGGCPQPGWQVREWPVRVAYAPCSTVRIFGLAPGDLMLLTTCRPPGAGVGAGTGDPTVTSIADNLGNTYPGNDDCTLGASLPQLQGWDCASSAAQVHMFCAPPAAQGSGLAAGAFQLDVTICAFGNASGNAPFYVWWKGSGNPNPG